MILERIIEVLSAVVQGVLGVLPSGDPPAWLGNSMGQLETLLNYGAGLGAWLPFSTLGLVVLAVLASMLAGFVIKVVRLVASYATAGGGSAG